MLADDTRNSQASNFEFSSHRSSNKRSNSLSTNRLLSPNSSTKRQMAVAKPSNKRNRTRKSKKQ